MTAPAWIVHRYGWLSSTMDHAEALAMCDAKERTIVVAHQQSAGRGRAGRVWESPPAAGLYCTAILRPEVEPARLSVLPLLIGLAVAQTLEDLTGAMVRLKWPNDVWLGDDPLHQKAAGVLLTSRLAAGRVEFVCAGIGINLLAAKDETPPGATSVEEATGLSIAPETVLPILLSRLEGQHAEFCAHHGRPSLAAWWHRAALRGEQVSLVDSGRKRTGIFSGLADDGALLLVSADGHEHRIVAGDLARGPVRVN